ncbi:ribonuclease J [Peribacillus deserti]|uniref:Ribonuclease J n=1 Tax=Peribacillus deserti TaxID=673318 RepID=A0ABS2QQ06_9BACI|nr:ribonuclease J [Peribacillus deserti]MBM7694774.1 ribonuclease J [Peribacillus deserti]
MKTENKIKIISLGGQGESGKNMYLAEVDEDIYILDAGLMYPEVGMYGIDVVIPDISYLLDNKHRIQGIFLTHGHEDHIGALPYILNQLKVPVYGTKLTVELAKANLREHEFKEEVHFEIIDSSSTLQFPAAEVSFFKTNHSIPDSVGICIDTPQGAIVYTGDFKFDQAASGLYQPEIGKMASIGEKGVAALLSVSSGAEKPGYTPSEAIAAKGMTDVFYNAKKRIIVACFASHINRIQHVFNAASENGKKVAVVGKSLQRVYEIALSNGYLDVPEDIIIPISEIGNYPDNQVVVLVTGSQGEPIEALQKMAKKSHKQINIQEGDTVLIAAPPIKGGEINLYKTMDMVYRAGAEVVSGRKVVNVPGHGSQEELKMMLNLMKPRFLLPVHGEYRMLKAHAKLAGEWGLSKERILIPDKGEVAEIQGESISTTGKVPAGNVLIDGSGVGDVGNIVLRDRRLLSQDGILIVVISLNKARKAITAGPEIISRGFVYVRESEKLMEEATHLVRGIVQKKDTFEWASLKQEIREGLNQYLYEKTKRRPMILPIIMEG